MKSQSLLKIPLAGLMLLTPMSFALTPGYCDEQPVAPGKSSDVAAIVNGKTKQIV